MNRISITLGTGAKACFNVDSVDDVNESRIDLSDADPGTFVEWYGSEAEAEMWAAEIREFLSDNADYPGESTVTVYESKN